jgi:hypothetical protein
MTGDYRLTDGGVCPHCGDDYGYIQSVGPTEPAELPVGLYYVHAVRVEDGRRVVYACEEPRDGETNTWDRGGWEAADPPLPSWAADP